MSGFQRRAKLPGSVSHEDTATPERSPVPVVDGRQRTDRGSDEEKTPRITHSDTTRTPMDDGTHVNSAGRRPATTTPTPTPTPTPQQAKSVLRPDYCQQSGVSPRAERTPRVKSVFDDGDDEGDGQSFVREMSSLSGKKTSEKVRVRYLSGDEIVLTNCDTVMDAKIQIATKHNKFVPHITLLASPKCLCAEDARVLAVQDDSKFPLPDRVRAPHEMDVVLGNLAAEAEESFWREALMAHATSRDEAGVRRAMQWLAQSADFDAAEVAGSAAFSVVEISLESADAPTAFQSSLGSADASSAFRTLLRCRANPNYICAGRGDPQDGRTLLVHAVDKQQVAFAEALMNSGRSTKNEDGSMVCDVNLPSVTNPCFTALHMAVRYNLLTLARMLLKCAANVEARAAQGSTPLILACFACVSPDDTIDEIISLLLRHSADIHAENESKWTPLHIAAHNNQPSLARLLLQMNADMRAADHDGWTPAHWAAKEGCLDVLAELLSTPEINKPHDMICSVDRNGATMLHWAAHQGHASCVTYLMQMRAHVNAADNTNRTPLYCAGKRDASSTLLESLLARQADPNIASIPAMVTPLHAVAHSGLNYGESNARVLLDFRANIHAVDSAGFTALHYATRKRHLKVMELMLWEAEDNDRKSRVEVTKLLNAQTTVQQQTALHIAVAADEQMLEEAALLLHARADVGAVKNSDGRTVMELANNRGNEDMIALLCNPRRYRGWLCGGM
eukprot:GEMP01010308.1.p1 GENE.GEMP01010308.1~~GEMP01010308.1.p1  ORF type:complete len:734 (+),score=218.44 GEMP01010308.1:312-2513(+)